MFEDFNSFKKRIAFFDNNQKISYGDIINFSKIINKFLKKKSLVLLVISNSIEGLMIYSSLIKNNNTTIIIDETLGKKFTLDIAKKYKVNYMFYPNNFIENLDKKNLIKSSGYKCIKLNNFDHKINNNNLILLTTSGTTSNPKLVRISGQNLNFNCEKIIESLQINKDNIACTSLPSGFAFGLSIINTHLSVGSKIFVTKSSIVEKIFWDHLRKFKITSLYGVPSTFKFLCLSKLYNKISKHLKYLAQAGGKLEDKFIDKLIEFSKRNKKEFFVMYGQTEASPRISCLNVIKNEHKKFSIGKPFKDTFIKLKSSKKIREKSFKEFVFYGKNVCLGYAKNLKDLEKGDINLGKLNTGDYGYMDKDGFFYIAGRIKKFSKINGLRIDLDDVEKFLKNKNIKSEAMIDNNYLKLNLQNQSLIDRAKHLLSKEYKINKNYIVCLHQSQLKTSIKKKSWKNFL